MPEASSADRDYFARVAAGQDAIADERPPASLAEMFEALEAAVRERGWQVQRKSPEGELLRLHDAYVERWASFWDVLGRWRALRGG